MAPPMREQLRSSKKLLPSVRADSVTMIGSEECFHSSRENDLTSHAFFIKTNRRFFLRLNSRKKAMKKVLESQSQAPDRDYTGATKRITLCEPIEDL